MIRMQPMITWKEALEPQAELIGQLVKPEVYKEYRKMKDRIEAKNKSGEPVDITDKDGLKGYAESDTHFDPNRGVIDKNGRVLVPKDKFSNMTGINGVAISV